MTWVHGVPPLQRAPKGVQKGSKKDHFRVIKESRYPEISDLGSKKGLKTAKWSRFRGVVFTPC
jgi:hypothetical protein